MLVASIIYALLLTALSAECYRVLQNASYRPQRGYFKLVLSWYFLLLAVLQGVIIVLRNYIYWLIPLYVAAALLCILLKRKSKLRFTKRIWRMLIVEVGTIFCLCYFVGIIYWTISLPIIVLVAWIICLPIDSLIGKYYIQKAQKKLFKSSIKVIAITGSYGKTSVKDTLATLLTNSITPQGSCNTPLGIAAFINRTDLSKYEYIILEFGARRKNDIKQLCDYFKPIYGIITGVCAQHLSTFKTLDNVIRTKRELVECLPQDGFCVLNAYDEIVSSFTDCGLCVKYLSNKHLSVNCLNVNFCGSEVEVCFDGNMFRVSVSQISEHIISILSICIQFCIRLKQDLSTTISNIAYLKQPKHRMEMSYNGHFYILDDSYNANMVGVESCARTLAKFDCKKVAIIQGIVECGKNVRQINERCAKLLGDVCDIVVVTGKNGKYLLSGLKSCKCTTLTAKNLDDAVKLVSGKVDGGILLFQNDLPDVVNI